MAKKKTGKQKTDPKKRSRPRRSEATSAAAEYSAGRKRYVDRGIRAVVVIGLVIAALLIVPGYLRGKQAKQKWDAAIAAHNAGDYDEAITLFKESQEIAPDYEDLQKLFPTEISKSYEGKAFKCEEQVQWLAAAKAYQALIEVNPQRALKDNIYLRAAQDFSRAKNNETALKIAKQGLEAHGGDNDPLRRFIERLERKAGKPTEK